MTSRAAWDSICHIDANAEDTPVAKSPMKPINEVKIDLNESALNNDAT
jgi:hypothetical protein